MKTRLNVPVVRPKGLLVDLDDTIVSDSDCAAAVWAVAVEAAAGVIPLPVGAVQQAIEKERAWYWRDAERHRVGRADLIGARRVIVTAALRDVGISAASMPATVDAIVSEYTAGTEAARRLLPGSLEALTAVSSLGIRMALVTNGAAEVQRSKITRFGLASLFEAIVVEGEFGQGKPELAVYLHALASLGVEAGEAWMVGDNLEWDVTTPRRLGMRGIWIRPAGPAEFDSEEADAILPDLPALAALLSSTVQA